MMDARFPPCSAARSLMRIDGYNDQALGVLGWAHAASITLAGLSLPSMFRLWRIYGSRKEIVDPGEYVRQARSRRTGNKLPILKTYNSKLKTDNSTHPFAFGGTYPSGNFAPSPKKNCSICSSIIFCELGSSGFKRYSFITIFEYSSQSFQASLETFSYTFLPSSPFQGGRSSPGISLPNFTHCTMRVPGLMGSLGVGVGPHESLAIRSSWESPFSARERDVASKGCSRYSLVNL